MRKTRDICGYLVRYVEYGFPDDRLHVDRRLDDGSKSGKGFMLLNCIHCPMDIGLSKALLVPHVVETVYCVHTRISRPQVGSMHKQLAPFCQGKLGGQIHPKPIILYSSLSRHVLE